MNGLVDAFEQAGVINEALTRLEDFAADTDDTNLSAALIAARSLTVAVGVRLARLLELDREALA